MTNWMPSCEPLRRLIHERTQRLLTVRRALADPVEFRRQLVLQVDDVTPLTQRLLPWQIADFTALDDAWRSLAGRPVVSFAGVRFRRAYLERARGHSKTSDMATQIAWILLAARRAVSGLAAAADRDQASLIHRAVRRLAAANPLLCRDLTFIERLVKNPRTGSQLEVISSDVRGSWGALPDFVICDELCHWRTPELWYSLLSSAAKKPECVLVVLTNAGIGRGWHWDVREHAQQDAGWYFSSLRGPQAPWISDEQLEEQKALLPPTVFSRLWLNEWQHSDGGFVSLAEAEACRDLTLVRRERGQPRTRYVAAVDYAEKRDYTVGCVCHQDGGRIVVDRMDVVVPVPGQPTPVQWVDDWIAEMARRFPRTSFVVDEHQLVGTIQRLERQHDIRRFDFGTGLGNHRLALHLRQLITQRRVAWYPDCGAIHTAGSPRNDLETELASLLLRESHGGRLRIDHLRDGLHHDDRAFSLGAACLHLSEHPDGGEELFLLTPPAGQGFAW